MIHMYMCWRVCECLQHTHSGLTGHWAANASTIRITICTQPAHVFLCLTWQLLQLRSTRARKRRPMSEEEEEVQDQKQTIDAKCQARTQRALWKRP